MNLRQTAFYTVADEQLKQKKKLTVGFWTDKGVLSKSLIGKEEYEEKP